MTASAPLIIGAAERLALLQLRQAAASAPVDIAALMAAMQTPDGKAAHRAHMTAQTVQIPGPWPFFVTLSIETGHPVGACRHMSMSILRKGRVPHPAAVWLVAEELGFSGGLDACRVWLDDLSDEHGGVAINVAQPLLVLPAESDGLNQGKPAPDLV
jgi:hypothetical protein